MLIKNNRSATAQFHGAAHKHEHHNFWPLAIGSIGVVYGDIGTSPLYAFHEAVKAAGGSAAHPGEIFGIISLIIWALMIIVTLKYIMLLLYADNRGEGGILSLTALAQKSLGQGAGFVIFLGLVGAALFYGDAAITPAISVLSAVEGLKLIQPAFGGFVLPLSVFILIILFWVQKSGTAKVSTFFGPIMVIWFLVIGAAGLSHVVQNPDILWTVNPLHAVRFLTHHGKISFVVLGAVFLAVTGAEALYADLGHFGRKPVQVAWLYLVFPCLILNYMGQGALMIADPKAFDNPFYLLTPPWALMPMVILATVATVIASQAVITGAYSLTQQAVQLGFLPRLEIQHTSAEHEGQIYMPKINRMLMLATLFLIVVFKSSDALASAYGIAVTGTMLTTSVLAYIVFWKNWGRGPVFAACLIAPFIVVETIFMSANLLKVFDGGIVPLLFAAFMITIMTIWVRGSRYLSVRTRRQTVPLADLIQTLTDHPVHIIPGTAIFLTGDSRSAPIALMQNLKHNKVLHDHNIILTVVTDRIPKVPQHHRILVDELTPHITSVILHFGYSETPDVPRALALCQRLHLDVRDVTYFLGRRTLVADGRRGLPEWQEHLFIPMARAAATATDFFRLPPGKVVELGVQIAV